MKYYCPKCGKILVRDKKQLEMQRKGGIKEYCSKSGQHVRLRKLPKNGKPLVA